MTELDKSLTAMDWLPTLGSTGTGTASSQNSPRLASSMNLVTSTGDLKAFQNVEGDTQMSNNPENKSVTVDGKIFEKPPYSYAQLITMAIQSQSQKRMTLSEIYQWICENHPYYREVGSGWKVCR